MKSSCICLLLVPFCLFADKVVLNTAPAGDGVIYDRNKDGLIDTVSSTVIETKKANIAMVAGHGRQIIMLFLSFRFRKNSGRKRLARRFFVCFSTERHIRRFQNSKSFSIRRLKQTAQSRLLISQEHRLAFFIRETLCRQTKKLNLTLPRL